MVQRECVSFCVCLFFAVNSKKMEFVERSSRFFYREGYKSGVSHFAIPLDHQGNRTHLISSNTVSEINV